MRQCPSHAGLTSEERISFPDPLLGEPQGLSKRVWWVRKGMKSPLLQRLLQHPGQALKAEGFLDESGGTQSGQWFEGLTFAVATGQDHSHFRIAGLQLEESLLAVHPGHGQVHEDKGEFAWYEALQGFLAISCGHHPEAEVLKHAAKAEPQLCLIIHQENFAVKAILVGPGFNRT